MATSNPTDVRASDGRVPGLRGLATRSRLLECTERLLADRSYRELRVIDVARAAGTSPATFYQYFPGVEAAVLALAEQMADDRERLIRIVRDTNWAGPRAQAGARALAAEFVEFWHDHDSVLRVVDLASAEGDPRFRALRTRLLSEVTAALAEVATEWRGTRRRGADPDPRAVGAVLVSMLSHVAAHQRGLEASGIRVADAQIVMAELIHRAVTGR